MDREWELWTLAAALLKRHREHAPVVIAARLGKAVTLKASDEIEFWKSIAAHIHSLMDDQRSVH